MNEPDACHTADSLVGAGEDPIASQQMENI